MLLAIETSCDETAVALFADGAWQPAAELISSQTKLHEPYGGVVPELAAREHIVNLPILVKKVLQDEGCSLDGIKYIAVTQGPGLKGSLLVGLSYAKALAFALGVPLLPVHHIEGHMLAGELMPEDQRPKYPVMALVVSGGHTMLVLMEAFRRYRVIASTRDDAAGEAFDKSATLLGLPYPGGPALSKLAETGDPAKYELPVGMAHDPGSFSFSGLKTAVYRMAQKLEQQGLLAHQQTKADLAASVQRAIVRSLVRKSVKACAEHRPRSFLVTGGVAANQELRRQLASEIGKLGIALCIPEFKWCTDNAAMIGAVARNMLQQDPQAYSGWKSGGAQLGPHAAHDIGALARWPIEELRE